MEAAPNQEAADRLPALTGAQRLVAFGTVLGLAGAALWLGPLRDVGRINTVITIPWWAEFAGCYLASLVALDVRIRNVRVSLSVTEIPAAIGLFLVDPHVLLGCYVIGVLLGRWTRRGVQPARDYSNAVLDVVYIATAVLVFSTLQPDALDPLAPRSVLTLAVAMASAGFVVAPFLLNLAVYFYQGSLEVSDAINEFLAQTMATTANTCLGLIGLLLATDHPLIALALVPPVALVFVVQLISSESRRRAERMEFLYTITDLLHTSPRVNDRAGELLAAISRMFDAARVELIVLPDTRGPGARFLSCNGTDMVAASQSELTYAEQEAFNNLRNRRILMVSKTSDSALSLILAERGVQSAILVALHGQNRPLGTLLLADRRNPRAKLTDEDHNLLITVAGQVSAAIDGGQLAGAIRSASMAGDEAQRNAAADALTRIPNRSLFLETTDKALNRYTTTHRPVGALVIDIDGFDEVNEQHGRGTGDKVLTAVAARLRAQIRKFDIAARLGGDEFGLLLDGMRHRGDADVVARRVIEALSQPIQTDDATVHITASIGVAVVHDIADVPGPKELLRRADMATYLAKRLGRGRFVVFDNGARELVITPPAPSLQPLTS